MVGVLFFERRQTKAELTATPKLSWAKLQNPAKNVIQKLVKLIGHTYVCNSLTYFEYEVT